MKIINHTFINIDVLNDFITKNSIPNSNQTLIQIYHAGVFDTKSIITVKNQLLQILPDATLMGTTTSGVVSGGKVVDNCIHLSFSLFEKSQTRSLSFVDNSAEEIIKKLQTHLITKDTKLLVLFANIFKCEANDLIKSINQKYPKLVICGGYAGDDFVIDEEKHLVVSKESDSVDVVIASIDSSCLHVSTNYFLNWQTIGKSMTITKSVDNVIYEIDHKRALDVYKEYLGEDLVKGLPKSGMDYPLIFIENSISVSRVPLFLGVDGSIGMSGNVPQHALVKFSFSNIERIDEKNRQSIKENSNTKAQGIYVYSCAARREILSVFLDDEFNLLNSIAPTTGFMTYGEFYHDTNTCKNTLLNTATTYVCLSENDNSEIDIDNINIVNSKKNSRALSLKALTHLIYKTSQDFQQTLIEQNSELQKTKDSLEYAQEIVKMANMEFDTLNNKIVLTQQARKLLRLKSDITVLSIDGFFDLIHPLDKKKIVDAYYQSICQHNNFYAEYKMKQEDDTVFYIKQNCVHQYDKNNKIIQSFVTIHDISKRKQTEIKLAEQNNIIMQQSKMAVMGEMIESITHQWKQPLSSIASIVSNIILKDKMGIKPMDDLIPSMLKIEDCIQFQSKTIDDFRDFFKPNKTKTSFEIRKTLMNTVSLIESQLQSNEITIIDNIEDITIYALENELIQVFLNILNNARDELIKKQKQKQKRIIFVDIITNGSNVEIKIKDNAGGIPEDIKALIFDPRFTTKSETHGSGIGLHMSRVIIQDHLNGKIGCVNMHFEYEHEKYVGAEFKILLPLTSCE